jgi:hypothetical protein
MSSLSCMAHDDGRTEFSVSPEGKTVELNLGPFILIFGDLSRLAALGAAITGYLDDLEEERIFGGHPDADEDDEDDAEEPYDESEARCPTRE